MTPSINWLDWMIYILAAAVTVLAAYRALVKPITTRIKDVLDRLCLVEETDTIILRQQIKDRCQQIIERDYIWDDELDDLNELVDLYETRDPKNGVLDRVERCRRLDMRFRNRSHAAEPDRRLA